MPVKLEYSNCHSSPSSFDCNMLSSEDLDEQFPGEIALSSSFEEMWNNFIPTPPQSPPMNSLDFQDDDQSLQEPTGDFDQVIHHDCMWSGQCSEGICNAMYKPVSKNHVRPATPFNLSCSPLNTFNYISPYDLNINETLSSYPEEETIEQQFTEGNISAVANDHSYDCSATVKVESCRNEFTPKRETSLIKKPITAKIITTTKTIVEGKISKPLKCKRMATKKFAEQSILKSTIEIEKSLKPTIISVANFKKLQESSLFHPKYKLAIKKKSDLEKELHCETIEVSKCLSSTSYPTPLISPSSSDSEESSFSSSFSDDRKREPPFRRREHNDSERKRRDHLRNSFNNLRDQIPKLKTSQKRPPRIMILHEAAGYVKQLIKKNHELEAIQNAEKAKRERLQKILASLA